MPEPDGLPTELLQEIMRLDVIDNDGDPQRLVWVSKRWAAVSLDTPTLWASIAISTDSRRCRTMHSWQTLNIKLKSVKYEKPSRKQWCSPCFLPSCLRRCRMWPRELEFHFANDFIGWKGISNLALLRWDECESLKIIGELDTMAVNQVLPQYFHIQLPALRHLEITDKTKLWMKSSSFMETLISSVCSTASPLTFGGRGWATRLYFVEFAPEPNAITELFLDLRDTYKVGDAHYINAFLRLNVLEKLTLYTDSYNEPMYPETAIPMFPALKKLNITANDLKLLWLHARGVRGRSRLTDLSILKLPDWKAWQVFTEPLTLPSLKTLHVTSPALKCLPYILAPKLESFRLSQNGQPRFPPRLGEPAHALDPSTACIQLISFPMTVKLLEPCEHLKSLRLRRNGEGDKEDIFGPSYDIMWKAVTEGMVGLVPELESLCVDIVVSKADHRDKLRGFLKEFAEARCGTPLREVIWVYAVGARDIIFCR